MLRTSPWSLRPSIWPGSWSWAWSHQRATSCHFFSVGQKINQKVYRRVLEDMAVLWMKRVAGGRKFTFQ